MSLPNIEQIDFLKIPHSNTSSIAIAEKALKNGIRVDGRNLKQFRNLKIEFLRKPGHVIVSLGNTKVFATVTAEIVKPNVEKPNEGILSFNLEISPMCSQSYEPARSSEREHSICHTIEKVFKESGALDVESLCIIAGKYVWCIRTNIRVLQVDGNLLDVCNVAALVALTNFRKPEAIAKHEQTQSVELDFNHSSPLTLYHMPILISVGVTKDADYTLIDASRFEENIVKTYIAMLFNQFGDLFFIRKLGGVAVAPQKINQIVDVGKRAAVDLYGVIKAQMRDFSDIQKDKVKQRHKQLVP